MSLKNMTKEDLELMNNKDITYLILEGRKTTLNTADLFKRIIKLLDLPESTFEEKIADYYTALSTDKRFILLSNGTWDLRNRQKSDKVLKVVSDEEDEDDEEELEENQEEDIDDDSDSYDDKEEEEYDEETNEELKDLVIIDEDELELEQ